MSTEFNASQAQLSKVDTNPMSHIMNALFKSVTDGIVVGDTEGRIIFANDAAIKINDNMNFPVNPEDRVLAYSSVETNGQQMKISDLPLRKALREGEIKGLEVSLLTAQGKRKNLICNGQALYSDKGERIGAVLVIHDQTLEVEESLRKDRLEKERSELLRLNAELERFSSVAAHDLKSPLNSITQFVDVLREDLEGRLGSREIEIFGRISNAAAKLRTLIDDLLSYARSGKDLRDRVSIDLDRLVDDVLNSLHADLTAAKAFVDVESLPVIFADRVGISQVFQNLISNALKYKSEKSPVIQIKATDENTQWRLIIKDNGVGIKEEDQPFAFDVFKRFDTGTQSDGTGLGLPICKRIIEAHGGSIWIESGKGQGTTMIFTLPKEERIG